MIVGRNRGKLHHIIVLAEGIGKPYEVAQELTNKTKMETRVTIIGHLQRGGSPSAYDRILASRFGEKAVNLLIENKSGLAVGNKGNEILAVTIEEAISRREMPYRGLYDLAEILS